MTPQLTIQIVGWNSEKDLKPALRVLKVFPKNEVVVRYIDNNSKDGSVNIVRQLLPDADVILNRENKGFSGGHNTGFAVCSTPFVMVHNPDLITNWPAIKELLLLFDDPKVGSVQGKLFRDNDQTVIDSVGIKQGIALDGQERGANESDEGQFDKEEIIFAATGACAIYRMKALREAACNNGQIYDEDFFAYKEDVDLGWRLNKAGWITKYSPQTQGVHKRAVGAEGFMNWGLNPAGVLKRLKSPRTRYSIRNYVWMLAKNATGRQLIEHSVFIAARLLIFFVLTFFYPPRLGVWPEIMSGLPKMIGKRRRG